MVAVGLLGVSHLIVFNLDLLQNLVLLLDLLLRFQELYVKAIGIIGPILGGLLGLFDLAGQELRLLLVLQLHLVQLLGEHLHRVQRLELLELVGLRHNGVDVLLGDLVLVDLLKLARVLLLQLGKLEPVRLLQKLAFLAGGYGLGLRLFLLCLLLPLPLSHFLLFVLVNRGCQLSCVLAPRRVAQLLNLLLFFIECLQHGLDLAILVLNDTLKHRNLRLELAKNKEPSGSWIGYR